MIVHYLDHIKPCDDLKDIVNMLVLSIIFHNIIIFL